MRCGPAAEGGGIPPRGFAWQGCVPDRGQKGTRKVPCGTLQPMQCRFRAKLSSPPAAPECPNPKTAPLRCVGATLLPISRVALATSSAHVDACRRWPALARWARQPRTGSPGRPPAEGARFRRSRGRAAWGAQRATTAAGPSSSVCTLADQGLRFRHGCSPCRRTIRPHPLPPGPDARPPCPTTSTEP